MVQSIIRYGVHLDVRVGIRIVVVAAAGTSRRFGTRAPVAETNCCKEDGDDGCAADGDGDDYTGVAHAAVDGVCHCCG